MLRTYFPASSPSTRLAPRGRGSCLGLRTGVSPHFSTNSIREMLVPLGCSARQQHQTRRHRTAEHMRLVVASCSQLKWRQRRRRHHRPPTTTAGAGLTTTRTTTWTASGRHRPRHVRPRRSSRPRNGYKRDGGRVQRRDRGRARAPAAQRPLADDTAAAAPVSRSRGARVEKSGARQSDDDTAIVKKRPSKKNKTRTRRPERTKHWFSEMWAQTKPEK